MNYTVELMYPLDGTKFHLDFGATLRLKITFTEGQQ